MTVYKKVSERLNITVTAVQNWVLDFELSNSMKVSKRGKHQKTTSPVMDNDEFKTLFKSFVKENSRKQGTKTGLNRASSKIKLDKLSQAQL